VIWLAKSKVHPVCQAGGYGHPTHGLLTGRTEEVKITESSELQMQLGLREVCRKLFCRPILGLQNDLRLPAIAHFAGQLLGKEEQS